MDEKSKLRRKVRDGLQEENQLLSRVELKSQTDLAMLKIELEWWKDTTAGKAVSSAGITSRAPPPEVIQRAPEGRSDEDQAMLDDHRRMLMRLEYSRTLTLDERIEMRRLVGAEYPEASTDEVKAIYAERLMLSQRMQRSSKLTRMLSSSQPYRKG